MMNWNAAPTDFSNTPKKNESINQQIDFSQELIYKYFIKIVKTWQTTQVLKEFKDIFIFHIEALNKAAFQAVDDILFLNREDLFRYTIKRTCYILINNWEAERQHKAIKELVQLFDDSSLSQDTFSLNLGRLRTWISNFTNSSDYQEIKLFALRDEISEEVHWSQRYTSYLLVPQYVDLANPIEQREAARTLAKQLKEKFKFDLAMYTAHSQSALAKEKKIKNPTALGDDVLRLIKTIVAKRGPFSYVSLANLFKSQVEGISYKEFKQSLLKYLTFYLSDGNQAELVKQYITPKLTRLYQEYDEKTLSSSLFLRTCNRLIEYLTTENKQRPSKLFIQLLADRNPMTLVIMLLKILLVSKHSQTHMEACVAKLILYYEELPQEQCQWIINFLEVFNITFAIHGENVEYNIVSVKNSKARHNLGGAALIDDDTYRVFSQQKGKKQIPAEAQTVELESVLSEAAIEGEENQ